MTWGRAWRWILAVAASGVCFVIVMVTRFSWYFSVGLSPRFELDPNGAKVGELFPPASLIATIGPMVVGAALVVLTGLAVFKIVGQLRPAQFAVLAGPLVAFGIELADTLYTFFFMRGAGETVAGAEPVVLIADLLLFVVPALMGWAAIRLMASARLRRAVPSSA